MNKEIFKTLCEKYNLTKIIEPLQELGYFEAPASSKYHLNYKGGLLKHSYNVYCLMLKLKEVYNLKLLERDIFVSAFLHDLDKVKKYKPRVINETTIYIWDDVIGLDNGIGSLYLATQDLGLTKAELSRDVAIAITYHMGFWGFPDFDKKTDNLKKFSYAFDLLTLLRHADEGATFILEKNRDFEK